MGLYIHIYYALLIQNVMMIKKAWVRFPRCEELMLIMVGYYVCCLNSMLAVVPSQICPSVQKDTIEHQNKKKKSSLNYLSLPIAQSFSLIFLKISTDGIKNSL